MMRVLHVIQSVATKNGGPSQALIGLAAAQRRLGMEVSVLIDDPAGKESDAGLRVDGIEVLNLHAATTRWSGRSNRSLRLKEAVRRAEVTHIHGVWDRVVFEAACVATAVQKPFVIRPCGMLDEWSLRQKRFRKHLYLAVRMRAVLHRAAALHVTSEMEAHSTTRAGIRFKRMILEPNGVSTEDFKVLPTHGTFRRTIGIGERPLITFLGRVHPGKGLEYLLPALEFIDARDAVVAVVGPADSVFAEGMKRRAASLSRRCEVVFTGILRGRDRIPPLADADVFALPSEHENFGLAVVEAMAAGCPVVVSHHVGLAAEVQRRNLGAVTTLAPADIAKALDSWICHERRDRSGRERRRSYALATYDWNAIAARWLGHYDRLTA